MFEEEDDNNKSVEVDKEDISQSEEELSQEIDEEDYKDEN